MIAGVDVSSRAVDVVLLDDDTDAAVWHHYELEGDTPFERARSCRHILPTRSWWDAVWLIGVEDPRGPHAHSVKAVGIVLGAFAMSLPPELPVVLTIAQEWKRLTFGAPSASKIDVALWAMEHGFRNAGVEAAYTPQDAYDAFSVAWAVRALNNEAIERGAA